jgi:hypothetical protein
MGHETFADGLGRIAIIDGIVRLDLISYSPTEHGPDGKPRQVFTHRVVMGMDQFLHASEKIAKTAEMIRQANQQQSAPPVKPQPTQATSAPAPQATPRPQAGPAPPSVAPQFRRESIKPDTPQPTPPPPQRPFP